MLLQVPSSSGRCHVRGVRRIFERGKRGVGAKRRLRSPRKMRRTASKVSCCMDLGAQLPDYFAELRANSIGFLIQINKFN